MCAGSKQAVLSVDAAASVACANRHDARHSVAVFAAGAAVAVAMGIDTADARRWGHYVVGSPQRRSTHKHEGGDDGPNSADSQVPPC